MMDPAGVFPGRVVLVGSGPGDIELLTLKAARLIGEADFLVHDALVQPEVLALARRAQVIPVGKRAGNPSARQSSINQILVDCARQGGLTVRLKGGDPLVFARAQEELAVLKAHGIRFEVVPGISTAQAAHAVLAMPMTERGTRRALVLATPQVHAPRWKAELPRMAAAAPVPAAGTTAHVPGGQAAPRPGTGSGDGNGDGQAPDRPPARLQATLDRKPCPGIALDAADIVADPGLRRWAEALVAAGSGSLYMAATVCTQVRDTLLMLGMPADTRAFWMIDVSLPGQTIIPATLGTLAPLPPAHAGKPALLVLGGEPHLPVDTGTGA